MEDSSQNDNLIDFFCAVGDRNHWSTYGPIQPRLCRVASYVGKESLQKVFGASSNEK